jgi:hypothetical protein
MSQGSWHIKPSEMRRTLETLRQVGLHVRTVEVTKDGIKIAVSETAETNQQDKKPNKGEWD